MLRICPTAHTQALCVIRNKSITNLKIMNKLIVAVFFLVSINLSAQKYNNITNYAIPYRKGDLWGYADRRTKEILVEPIYDSVSHDFLKTYRWVPKVSKNGKWGLFAYNTDNKNYELVAPIKYDSIVGIGSATALWENGHFMFLDENFKNVFDDQDYFIDYFLEYDHDFTVILKRKYNNDVWCRQVVNGRHTTVFLDSILKIDKIVNEVQYSKLEKETYPLFVQIKNKNKEIIKSLEDNIDTVGYFIAQPDPPKMYPLLFTNPNSGQQYVFYEYRYGKNKLEQFIKVSTTKIMKKEDRTVHYSSSKKNKKSLKKTEFKIDNILNNKKYKTNNKNKYTLTDKYYDNIRLIQSPKTKQFGIIRNDGAFSPNNVLIEPEYANVLIYQLKYSKKKYLVLEKSNGKKNIFYNGKIQDLEFDEINIFPLELRYSNDGLKGIAFSREQKLIILPAKFSEIPEPNFHDKGYLRVCIPDNVYYYLSTGGTEFYEE